MAKRRNVFWLIFLGTAVVLALIPEFFETPPEEVVQAVPPAQRRGQLAELRSPAAATATTESAAQDAAAAPTPTDAVAPAAPAQRAGSPAGPEVDLFAAHSWYVAPPPPPPAPPAAPAPPPAPVAPPLPFAYFGKLDDRQRVRVFLQRGERIYTVGVGDVIDGTYKVKSITDSQMTLIYLPLDVTQTLSVGSRL